jgi:hypothetical protein
MSMQLPDCVEIFIKASLVCLVFLSILKSMVGKDFLFDFPNRLRNRSMPNPSVDRRNRAAPKKASSRQSWPGNWNCRNLRHQPVKRDRRTPPSVVAHPEAKSCMKRVSKAGIRNEEVDSSILFSSTKLNHLNTMFRWFFLGPRGPDFGQKHPPCVNRA